jgi:hypothetical protein
MSVHSPHWPYYHGTCTTRLPREAMQHSNSVCEALCQLRHLLLLLLLLLLVLLQLLLLLLLLVLVLLLLLLLLLSAATVCTQHSHSATDI